VAEGGEPAQSGRGPSWRIDQPETFTEWLTARGLHDVRVVTKQHRMPITDTTAWAIVMGSAMRMRLNGVAESALPKVRARFIDLLAARKVDHMNAVSLIGMGRTEE
jgi:hypothetical protein